MSEHSLKGGVEVIETLTSLGSALGYLVRPELPVEQRANAPAVDVAWFADDEQTYPLMIFEVESSATNAMANNPTKVYGQAQEKFERPLFFFHIVVSSGAETTRIDNLRRLFGVHNYRVYELERGMGKQLLCDVLSQHRRLHSRFDLGACLAAIESSVFADIAPEVLVSFARSIGLRSRYLRDLAALTAENRRYAEAFFWSIEQRTATKHAARKLDLGYESYWGRSWSTPIHIAILVHSKKVSGENGLKRLKRWQGNDDDGEMSQIGPHFGLSRDYDLFILGMAAGLWVLLANLMASHQPTIEYIASEILRPLASLRRSENGGSFYTAIWGAHVSAFCETDELFDTAREFINDRGGVPEACLYLPPSMLNLDDEGDWLAQYESPTILVPTKQEFRTEVSQRARACNSEVLDPLTVACDLLCFDDGTYEGLMSSMSEHLAFYMSIRSEGQV